MECHLVAYLEQALRCEQHLRVTLSRNPRTLSERSEAEAGVLCRNEGGALPIELFEVGRDEARDAFSYGF